MSSNTVKSPTVAYLLWFFLGGFGAHRFYMGRTGSAIGMIALFLGSMIGSVIVIGAVGFLALFAWWVADAFLMRKWFEEGSSAVASGQLSNQSNDSFSEAA